LFAEATPFLSGFSSGGLLQMEHAQRVDAEKRLKSKGDDVKRTRSKSSGLHEGVEDGNGRKLVT
jgi:hypothetical protein